MSELPVAQELPMPGVSRTIGLMLDTKMYLGFGWIAIVLFAFVEPLGNLPEHWPPHFSLIDITLSIAILILGLCWLPTFIGINLRSTLRTRNWRREFRQGQIEQSIGTVLWDGSRYQIETNSGRRLILLDETIGYLANEKSAGYEKVFSYGSPQPGLLSGTYRLTYLPQSGLLLAAEWVDEPSTDFNLLLKLAHGHNFSLRMLMLNRAGRAGFTPSQASWFTCTVFMIFVLFAVIAGLGFILPVSFYLWTTFCLFLWLSAWCGLLLYASAHAKRYLSNDSFAPRPIPEKRRIATVDGPIQVHLRRAYPLTYEYEINGQRFVVNQNAASALAPEPDRRYRIYFRQDDPSRIQSMEPLPD